MPPRPPLPPQPADTPWPTRDWPRSEPDADVDREVVARAFERLVEKPDPDVTGETHALLAVHRGRLVAEAYGPERDRDTTLLSWSVAKSFTHALIGILVRDGKLDVHAAAPVPSWQGVDDPRSAITSEDLLRMVDGLDFVEDYVDADVSSVIDMLFGKGKGDVAGYAEQSPRAHPPGRYWNYSSGTANIVAAIAGRCVGGGAEQMRAFMDRELFDRIGMGSATARFDDAGHFIGSSFVFATARDFARFGLLYLRDGLWEGERLLPAGWVDHARTLTPASFDQYGAHWWLARDGSGIFHASGYRGQYIVVVPERDLVVVRLGLTDEAKRVAVVHTLAELVRAFPLS
ncbi:MAG: serine hydrolase [Proteobacteria bacterium]|nr:serine hydrolase [Pseudomonadota bacterium]